MTYTKEWYEEAAATENQHVRAVLLQKDHLKHDRAFEVANRACEMAAGALGERRPAYAVARQNIGLYDCVIGSDIRISLGMFVASSLDLGMRGTGRGRDGYRPGTFPDKMSTNHSQNVPAVVALV